MSDNALGNTYSITGLSLLKDYYIYVGAVDSDGYEYIGPTYKISTTAT